jgi:hypothetical protein
MFTMASVMVENTGLLEATPPKPLTAQVFGDGDQSHGGAVGKVLGQLLDVDVLDHQDDGGHGTGQHANLNGGDDHAAYLDVDQADGDDQGQQGHDGVGQALVGVVAEVVAGLGHKVLAVVLGLFQPEVQVDDADHQHEAAGQEAVDRTGHIGGAQVGGGHGIVDLHGTGGNHGEGGAAEAQRAGDAAAGQVGGPEDLQGDGEHAEGAHEGGHAAVAQHAAGQRHGNKGPPPCP